jgi:hypothetical protein
MSEYSVLTGHLKIRAGSPEAICGVPNPLYFMYVAHPSSPGGKQWFLNRKDEFTLCLACANHPLVTLAELGGAVL